MIIMSIIDVLSAFNVIENLQCVLNCYEFEMQGKNPLTSGRVKMFLLSPIILFKYF